MLIRYDSATSKEFLETNTFDLLSNKKIEKKFILPSDYSGKFLYRALLQDSSYQVVFESSWAIEADLYVLCVLGENHPLDLDLQVILAHSEVKVTIHLVALVFSHQHNMLKATITMPPGIQNSECHLLEETIILSDEVDIKALPILDIHSNEIAASHGAKIYKLSPDFLFYFQSRGFSFQQAQQLFLKSYFDRLWDENVLSEEQKREIYEQITLPVGYKLYH